MSTSLIYVTNFRAVTSYNNRLEVLAVATVKTNTFRDVTPCSLMFTNVWSTCCSHYILRKWRNVLEYEESIFRGDGEDFGKCLPDCKTSHSRRKGSSIPAMFLRNLHYGQLSTFLRHNLICVPSVSVSNRTLTMEIRSVRRGSSKDHHLSVKLSPAHQLIQDCSGSCQATII